MSGSPTSLEDLSYLAIKSRLIKNSGIDQTIVTIKIGPDAKDFHIHRELLCKASRYFQGTFKGEFSEARDRVINLDDISVRTFETVQRWLYSGILLLPADSDAYLDPNLHLEHPNFEVCDDCGEVSRNDKVENWAFDLLDVSVLADKYNFPSLWQETMINLQHLNEIGGNLPSLEIVCQTYERRPEHSALCTYMVDMYVRRWDPKVKSCPTCYEEEVACFTADKLPRAFMFEVLVKSHHNIDDKAFCSWKMDWCDHHEHNGEEEIRSCRTQRKLDGRFSTNEYMDGESEDSDDGDEEMQEET